MTTNAGFQHEDDVQASYDLIGSEEPGVDGFDLSLLMMLLGISLMIWCGIALITPDWLVYHLLKSGFVFTVAGAGLYAYHSKGLWARR